MLRATCRNCHRAGLRARLEAGRDRMNCLLTFAILAAAPAAAQVAPASPATPAAPQAPVAPPQRPQVSSPVVDGDKTTFAIYAPKASEVTLSSGEIDRLLPGRNKPFTKAENGVWS